jgi:hypothetical protein
MHARRAPLAVEICDGLNRFVVVAGVFLFALAMAAAALQGPGPRTVEVNFPDRTQVQTESAPTSAAPTP